MQSKGKTSIKVVDLFCGIGGLTHGFILEGLSVVAGYDLDKSCKYAYEFNNKVEFVHKDVNSITKEELLHHFKDAKVKILAGCAPCQPFSTYSYKSTRKEKWGLINQFAELIEQTQPDIISMENVPRLVNFSKEPIFENFINTLKKNNYFFSYKIVHCPDYGIPQFRKRLVLLASKKGAIELIPPTHSKKNYITVRDVIGNLEPINHGEASVNDPIHKASKLSALNLKRIRQSKQGGTWRDWSSELQLKCHKKSSGKSYVSVYGRMSWDKPAPTMTTQCIGLGNGRFGHPEQDRAISLREAAMLQTFPKTYKFVENTNSFKVKNLSTHIGNSVPVKLAQVIAKSILLHIKSSLKKKTTLFNY